jgi:hypothetical protein
MCTRQYSIFLYIYQYIHIHVCKYIIFIRVNMQDRARVCTSRSAQSTVEQAFKQSKLSPYRYWVSTYVPWYKMNEGEKRIPSIDGILRSLYMCFGTLSSAYLFTYSTFQFSIEDTSMDGQWMCSSSKHKPLPVCVIMCVPRGDWAWCPPFWNQIKQLRTRYQYSQLHNLYPVIQRQSQNPLTFLDFFAARSAHWFLTHGSAGIDSQESTFYMCRVDVYGRQISIYSD